MSISLVSVVLLTILNVHSVVRKKNDTNDAAISHTSENAETSVTFDESFYILVPENLPNSRFNSREKIFHFLNLICS